RECIEESSRLAHEGRFKELTQLYASHDPALRAALTPGDPTPQHENEELFINRYLAQLQAVSQHLLVAPSMQKKAHEYVVQHLPTFIYMSDYRAFTGTAQLDHVKDRREQNSLTEEDKTLLTILELSGLHLEEEVQKGTLSDREQRQYDLDDASAT